MSMRSEVKEAMTKAAADHSQYGLARYLRGEDEHLRTCWDSQVCEAALSVIDQWEEVKVKKHLMLAGDSLLLADVAWASQCPGQYRGPTLTILMRKQKPEPSPVTISRETLALLNEYYEDSPEHSAELDQASAEAKKVL